MAVFGVGINDVPSSDKELYTSHWRHMLCRCYSARYQQRAYRYAVCEVDEPWKLLSNFKEWFDINYVEDWQLDKDILVPFNTLYSAETCVFVPQGINKLLTDRSLERGLYPVGVRREKRWGGRRFYAQLTARGKRGHVGSYDNPEEAFKGYVVAKLAHAREIVTEYPLTETVREAVINTLIHKLKVEAELFHIELEI